MTPDPFRPPINPWDDRVPDRLSSAVVFEGVVLRATDAFRALGVALETIAGAKVFGMRRRPSRLRERRERRRRVIHRRRRA